MINATHRPRRILVCNPWRNRWIVLLRLTCRMAGHPRRCDRSDGQCDCGDVQYPWVSPWWENPSSPRYLEDWSGGLR